MHEGVEQLEQTGVAGFITGDSGGHVATQADSWK